MSKVEKNVRWWDRSVRYLLGLVVLAWAIAGGPWWTIVGLYPLVTAAFGFCPFYWLLRIRGDEAA